MGYVGCEESKLVWLEEGRGGREKGRANERDLRGVG